MQRKVSMVMPCYNKVRYIAEMFNSILAQEWNNIELVLVNDGSTDGTREIIDEYEPKFHERGYEVVIVDQENAGVCAAVKVGFERITGDYVCQVDADDELDPQYCSVMVGWLEEHKDFDIGMCSYFLYEYLDGRKKRLGVTIAENENGYNELDRWLLCQTTWTPWVYMVRKDYFDKCGIVENFYTESRGSHEPFYAIPLLAHGGKIKCFNDLLYHFNSTVDETRHSLKLSTESAKKHREEYWRNARIAIKSLDINVFEEREKIRMLALLNMGMNSTTFLDFRVDSIEALLKQQMETLKIIDRIFLLPKMNFELCDFTDFWQSNELFQRCCFINSDVVVKYIIQFLLSRELPLYIGAYKRIIGYGSRGAIAKDLLPVLQSSVLEPTELWDLADGNCDFDSLCENDCVIVFPAKSKIREEIKPALEASRCRVLYFQDIPRQYIAECLRFGFFEDFIETKNNFCMR